MTPSTLRSNSDSDSGSIISQPCLACDGRLTQSERSLDTQPDTSRLHVQHCTGDSQMARSRSSSRPEDRSEAENLSYMRRSSAPEIDHESPAEEEVRSRREMFTRSLGRTRRQGGESGRSSDGESARQDPEELQRARAHLKETLEGKIGKLKKIEAEKYQNQTGETKAVVHRADGSNTHKTLDSEAIKQYQNIKQNTAALASGKQRYSGMFSEGAKAGAAGAKERHPTVQAAGREHPGIYKQTSFDNLTRNSESATLPRERHEGRKNLQYLIFYLFKGPIFLEGASSSSLRDSHSPLFVPELKKQDSFEGHEAAVRSLVEAVHESRKLEAKQRKKSEG